MTVLPSVSFTFPPCPDWCRAEHNLADDIEFGARIHEHVVWYREDEDVAGLWRVFVRLTACDSVDGTVDPVRIDVYSKDGALTLAEARVFAVAIQTGVGLVEEWSTPR